jgi:hypothetical protein
MPAGQSSLDARSATRLLELAEEADALALIDSIGAALDVGLPRSACSLSIAADARPSSRESSNERTRSHPEAAATIVTARKSFARSTLRR